MVRSCNTCEPAANWFNRKMNRHATNRFELDFATEGGNEVINLIPEIAKHAKLLNGIGVLHLFVVGSTAGLTTIEFEPGLIHHDLKDLMQRLIPDDVHYHHEATWHDDNGHSHLRAAFLGPSLSIPFENGKLLTGEYQQPVLVDFDTRPRRRKIIATIL